MFWFFVKDALATTSFSWNLLPPLRRFANSTYLQGRNLGTRQDRTQQAVAGTECHVSEASFQDALKRTLEYAHHARLLL